MEIYRFLKLFFLFVFILLIFLVSIGIADSKEQEDSDGKNNVRGNYIVIAYNDLGMHCTNADHSIISILPPYNNLIAQVIQRGDEPKIITKGVVVEYRFIQNTSCSGINFWDYASQIFGKNLSFCTGLTGKTLKGTMKLDGNRFVATGLPLTPFNDNGSFNPYPLVEVVVRDSKTGNILARTTTVAPVSHEMNCQKCHGGSGGSDTMLNILRKHDEKEGTNLTNNTPVLCQDCHADPILNKTGKSGVPSFSLAIHEKHSKVVPQPGCYDCHPGPLTKCLRTSIKGMQNCESCHGKLKDMVSSLKNGRKPWFNEPKCSDCHTAPEVDTGNVLYRNAKGHHGVSCSTCHYEPHAWWPSQLAKDNRQAILLQGELGVLGKNCLACHTSLPDENGPHGISPSGTVKIVNAAPDLFIQDVGTFQNPPKNPAAHISLMRDKKIVLMPSMIVPKSRIGEKVNLYYMICPSDHSWCTKVKSLGNVTLGQVVRFPIVDIPINISSVPAGTYQVYIGFSRKLNFSDIIFSYYEIDLH